MRRSTAWLKPAIFTGAMIPLVVTLYQVIVGTIGANPIAESLNRFGLLALIFLIVALAMTPLRAVFGWSWPLRVRRLVGIIGFSYAALHLLTYVGVDQGFRFATLLEDVLKRRFIFVGMAAFLLLVPLAITSTNGMVRRLGFRNWQRLHRLAYIATILGVIHFIWRVKKDITKPVIYGVVLACLLGFRLVWKLRSGRPRKAAPRPAGGGLHAAATGGSSSE